MDSIDHTDPAVKFDELTDIAGRALHREAGEAGGWFAKVLALRRAHLCNRGGGVGCSFVLSRRSEQAALPLAPLPRCMHACRLSVGSRVSERGGDSDLQIMGGTAREHYW